LKNMKVTGFKAARIESSTQEVQSPNFRAF